MTAHHRLAFAFLLYGLLLCTITSAESCSSKFISLPSAMLGTRVYFLTKDSAEKFCRTKGFSKSGGLRTTTLDTMGVSMSAVRLNSLNILSTRSTEMIVAVECLTAGQTACTADANGNIGTSNKGKRNFGTRNTGDDNVGNNNTGTSNWGDNNRGKGNRCFDKEEPTHPDSRQEFATPNLTKTFPAPSSAIPTTGVGEASPSIPNAPSTASRCPFSAPKPSSQASASCKSVPPSPSCQAKVPPSQPPASQPSSQPASSQPSSQPASSQPSSQPPPSQPSSQPAASQPPSQPAASQPATSTTSTPSSSSSPSPWPHAHYFSL
ncbi:hypothetical protein ACKKBG_A09785 [Auxenochlorella protothecoides x Auxenochlorella symbiontica]